jgi:hypothetical protein
MGTGTGRSAGVSRPFRPAVVAVLPASEYLPFIPSPTMAANCMTRAFELHGFDRMDHNATKIDPQCIAMLALVASYWVFEFHVL